MVRLVGVTCRVWQLHAAQSSKARCPANQFTVVGIIHEGALWLPLSRLIVETSWQKVIESFDDHTALRILVLWLSSHCQSPTRDCAANGP